MSLKQNEKHTMARTPTVVPVSSTSGANLKIGEIEHADSTSAFQPPGIGGLDDAATPPCGAASGGGNGSSASRPRSIVGCDKHYIKIVQLHLHASFSFQHVHTKTKRESMIDCYPNGILSLMSNQNLSQFAQQSFSKVPSQRCLHA